MDFPNLFSPIKVNNMLLKNRIVMTAMHLRYTPEGEVTDKLVDFYVRRAQGGVGLIVVGGCRIDELGGMSSMIGIDDDRYIPGLARLAGAVLADHLSLEAQFEIGILFLGAEKLVAFKRIFEGSTHDCAVLDAKDRLVAFPAGEVLAIKDRDKALLSSGLLGRG